MLLTATNIHQRFGEATVLRGVDFSLEAGQILGLIGENGAGKSTLMNIVSGLLSPSQGELRLDDQPFRPLSPQEAQAAGIGFIHQELNLFPNLSVAENLLLTHLPQKNWLGLPVLNRKQASAQARQLLEQVGLDVSPNQLLEQLGPAQQQLVEVAKALGSRPRIIIFDEPTTALTQHEREHLFTLMRQLQTNGMAMIYISHNLEEVMELADAILVLRDGERVAHYDRSSDYELSTLVNHMVGRTVEQFFPTRDTHPSDKVLLEVSNLRAGQRVRDVSFAVRQSEVVGFYGLVGAGRTEMARLLYGLDPAEGGQIQWKGHTVTDPTPRYWIEQQVGFLTEDRREEGLLMPQNIDNNVRLAGLPTFARRMLGTISFSELRAAATQQADATRVKYHNLAQQPVRTLSGGNQQKVVLAKWLMIRPALLILDEPTKGIDVGAKHEIYTLINQRVAEGMGVLFISSELEELMGLCDRILVISQGSITAEFARPDFDRSALLAAALHGGEKPTSG
ncbi:MAG: sugar ABC transporter ATP-binding protein [Tunicatimonas sp.]